MFGYQHTCTHDGDRCPDFDVDPFITATVEREIALDERNAAEYVWSANLMEKRINRYRPGHTGWKALRVAEAEVQRTSKAWAEEAQLVYGSGPDLTFDNLDDVRPLLGLVS